MTSPTGRSRADRAMYFRRHERTIGLEGPAAPYVITTVAIIVGCFAVGGLGGELVSAVGPSAVVAAGLVVFAWLDRSPALGGPQVRRTLAVCRRRLTDDRAEGPAERPEADEADVEADLAHAAIRLAQEEHRPLHAAPLKVAVWRLAEGGANILASGPEISPPPPSSARCRRRRARLPRRAVEASSR